METDNLTYSQKLLALDNIAGVAVKASAHYRLNAHDTHTHTCATAVVHVFVRRNNLLFIFLALLRSNYYCLFVYHYHMVNKDFQILKNHDYYFTESKKSTPRQLFNCKFLYHFLGTHSFPILEF